jgi:1,2-diacylglycerol 3-alpha-glucosyltransferase
MKVLHCCLAQFYVDDFSYQENILPRMHQLQGHNVSILASTETYIQTKLGYVKPSSYRTKEGIPVTRIAYVKGLPNTVAKKLRIYNGVSNALDSFEPDIIFIHDSQFISIKEIAKYAKKHKKLKIFVDGHTDFINSGKSWISKNILHKIIYKWCAQKINPYTKKFYGVLPIRVDFYHDVYGINKDKIELLPLGADLTKVDFSKASVTREKIRKELNVSPNDFVVISGGKLDRRKNIHLLMKAINDLPYPDCKLIVFGKADQEMENEINKLGTSPKIKSLGWIHSEKAYNYLLAADVAVFPGTHSVLWEQAVGVGLPCIFKKWHGIQHIDLDGNCLFLERSDIAEIKEKITLLYNNKELLANMKRVAVNKGIIAFSYYEIAKRAIEE